MIRRLALALAGVACRPEPTPSGVTDTDGAASATSTGSTGSATIVDTTVPTTAVSDTAPQPDAGCDCALPDNHRLASYDAERCGWGPCGTIEVVCPVSLEDDTGGPPQCAETDSIVLDVAAIDCALDLLVAGTPGVVSFEIGNGWAGEGGFVRIGASRTGLARRWEYEDLGCSESELAVIQLRAADYFAGCTAMADPYARFRCLVDWTEGPAASVCEGFDSCSES